MEPDRRGGGRLGRAYGPYPTESDQIVVAACGAKSAMSSNRGVSIMRASLFPFALLLLAACTQHRLVVPRPNPTGEPIAVSSNSFAGAQQRIVADCPTNLIDEVRVKQNLLQSLATVLTLGLWMPAKIEYKCAKVPTEEGSTEDGSDR